MFEDYTLHHVGLISPTEEDATFLMESLGLKEDYRGYVETFSCWCIFTKAASGASIELVVPDGGSLAKYNKGFGGIHHFAFEVEDIAAKTEELAAQDIKMIEPDAVKGAGNFLCNFLNPIYTRGQMVELVQPLGANS